MVRSGAIKWRWIVELQKKLHCVTRFSLCSLFSKGQQDRDQLLQDGQEDGHEEAEERHVEPSDREPWQAPRGEWSSSSSKEGEEAEVQVSLCCLPAGGAARGAGGGLWGQSLQWSHQDAGAQVRSATRAAPVSQTARLAPSWPSLLLPSSLPSTMAQNLSVPLAFVALLHLANEKVSLTFKIKLQTNLHGLKQVWGRSLSVWVIDHWSLLFSAEQNLELVKVDDMSDIIIRQGQWPAPGFFILLFSPRMSFFKMLILSRNYSHFI